MNPALMSVMGSVEDIVLDDETSDVSDYVPPRQHDRRKSTPIVDSDQPFKITPINNNESWIKRKWRPAIAWQYVAVCLFDFIIAPIFTMLLFNNENVTSYIQWSPITLQGGGLYHAVMGAIIGVYAWSRGQEKLKGIEE